MPGIESGFTPAAWLALVALGALTGPDSVSWPQAMFSRPVVAATLGGWVVGRPEAGLLAGAVLELLALRHAPLGAARYPDTGPAGVAAGGALAAGGTGVESLAVAAIVGWGLAWLGTLSVTALRRVNETLVRPSEILAAEPERLERRHRAAIALDALRGALLVAAFAVPAALAVGLTPPLTAGVPGAAAYAVAALVLALAAAAGSAARHFAFGLRGWPLLLVGAGVTALLIGVVG